ncbi:MAG: GNAT family N-acetyltransferase [Gammaproteobacteria bacterium]|jgi:GNAT superfamily N-acetyltransferase
MDIQLATSDAQIAACYPVMSELRPHIVETEFVARVREQMETGFRLAFLTVEGRPVAVAGFRFMQNLAWGRFLYVDDLVSCATERSRGYGAALLDWLVGYAASNGCDQLHLDSGTQRKDAHRFYEREGLDMTSLHFCRKVPRH